MKSRILPTLLFFVLLFSVAPNAIAQNQAQIEIDSISSWIARLLFIQSNAFPNADGAIVLTPPAPGSCFYQGNHYQVVIPTFATGCAQVLLRSTRMDKEDKVFRFMNWFRAHYDAYTVPTPTFPSSHWYYKVGGNIDLKGSQIGCSWGADPAYGDAALPQFCILAYEFYQYTKDTTWFLQPGVKNYLEQNMDYIIDTLLKSNDLTWGHATYPFNLTMDNCTVFWGFDYLGRIEHYIYHDAARASKYFDVSARVRHAIKTSLLYTGTNLAHTPDSTYIWHYLGDGFDTTRLLQEWYPRVTATIAPQVNGVDNPCDALSHRQRDLINHFFDGGSYPNWILSSPLERRTDLSYAHAYAGDTARAIAHLAALKDTFMYNFQFPFTGADAYFHALTYEKLVVRPDCNYGDLTMNYCPSGGTTVSENSIRYLQIGNLQQTSGFTNGHADFTSECHVLKRDTTYQVVFYPGKFPITAILPVKWRVWIDANQNGQYETQELVFDQSGNNVDPITMGMYVPVNCALGYTGLRVSLKADTSILVGPCAIGFDGDVEDYCVKIQNAIVGLEEVSQSSKLKMGPNPAISEIGFSRKLASNSTFAILDLNGRIIQSGAVVDSKIKLTDFTKGIYFLQLIEADLPRIFRFVRM